MSKENFRSFYVVGLRAFQSAAKQGTENAATAIEKFNDAELAEIATKIKVMFIQQEKHLIKFLNEHDAPVDEFHDQIMDGVTRGTALMLEAAKDHLMTDVALVSGGTNGMEYFVNAFKKYAANSELLGYQDRVEIFNTMAKENQDLIEAYAQIMEKKITPQIMEN